MLRFFSFYLMKKKIMPTDECSSTFRDLGARKYTCLHVPAIPKNYPYNYIGNYNDVTPKAIPSTASVIYTVRPLVG
jgi:hypothetical protein